MRGVREWEGVSLKEAVDITGKTENTLLRLVGMGGLEAWWWRNSGLIIDEHNQAVEETGWLKLPGEVIAQLVKYDSVTVKTFICLDGRYVFPAEDVNQRYFQEVIFIKSSWMGTSGQDSRSSDPAPEYNRSSFEFQKEDLYFSPLDIEMIKHSGGKDNEGNGRPLSGGSTKKEHGEKVVPIGKAGYSGDRLDTNLTIIAGMIDMISEGKGFKGTKYTQEEIQISIQNWTTSGKEKPFRGERSTKGVFSEANKLFKNKCIDGVTDRDEELDLLIIGAILKKLLSSRKKVFSDEISLKTEIYNIIKNNINNIIWLTEQQIGDRLKVAKDFGKKLIKKQKNS